MIDIAKLRRIRGGRYNAEDVQWLIVKIEELAEENNRIHALLIKTADIGEALIRQKQELTDAVLEANYILTPCLDDRLQGQMALAARKWLAKNNDMIKNYSKKEPPPSAASIIERP